MGGPNNYHGRDMKTTHAKLGIDKSDFDAAWACFEASLHEHKIEGNNFEDCKKVFYSVFGDVVTK